MMKGESMKGLNSDIEAISWHLTKRQADFDSVMQITREVIRDAGQAITLMHNDEVKKAASKIKGMASSLRKLRKLDPEFRYYTSQAYQEYAEAFIFFGIKKHGGIPGMKMVSVDREAYLMGLMDVVGELKREILESLRKNDVRGAEHYLDTMKQIYDSTRSLRFAEAVLNGFRKKQDVARIQIENAGSEILSARHRVK